MAGEWQAAQLGDVTDLLTGFPFRSERYVNDPSAPRLLRGDNVAQGVLRWDGVKRWPTSGTDAVALYRLREGDVILAMDRPWIEAGLKYASVRQSDLPALLVQRVARLRGSDRLDTGFLKYLIGSQAFTDYVLAVQTGTAVPHISGGQIQSFEFLLPSLPEQCGIAHILGTLDDKIELNRRMNETLEAMARALFKSRFVDFDPVRANAEGRERGLAPAIAELFPDSFEDSGLTEIPKGWQFEAIGDVVKVVGGSTPSTGEPRFWEDGAICWATPKDLSKLASPALLDTERHITRAGLAQIGSGLLPAGTVLLSSRAPIGYLAIAEVPTAVNQGFIALVCDGGLPNHYVLHWAKANMEIIEGRANGTTFMEVSKAAFRPIPVIVPTQPVLHAYQRIADALHARLVSNLRQSATLAALRDALLPKLISGELRVKHAERIVEVG
jgi:type I restriction enzyme S subunit